MSSMESLSQTRSPSRHHRRKKKCPLMSLKKRSPKRKRRSKLALHPSPRLDSKARLAEADVEPQLVAGGQEVPQRLRDRWKLPERGAARQSRSQPSQNNKQKSLQQSLKAPALQNRCLCLVSQSLGSDLMPRTSRWQLIQACSTLRCQRR